jgi:hypothetical protein
LILASSTVSIKTHSPQEVKNTYKLAKFTEGGGKTDLWRKIEKKWKCKKSNSV